MSDWTGPTGGSADAAGSADEVDEPTQRLSRYLAIGAAVHFFAHLLGIGVDGVRIEFLDPFLFVAARMLGRGSLGARTALLAFYLVAAALVSIAVLAVGELVFFLAFVVFGGAVLALHIAAVAYAVASAPPALGLPERHRPWATSRVLHVVILLFALASVFTPST